MKKFVTFLFVAVSLVGNLQARERSMDEKFALAISALAQNPKTRTVVSKIEQLKATDTYTVMGNKNGFVILSNDDAFDAIIAYADGNFNLASANTSLGWYLKAASQAMKAALHNGNFPTRANVIPTGDYKEEIQPLCKTLWAQGKPYNNLCPTNSNGSAYPSGCVATALSQIMFYHKYPVTGKGSHQYSFTPSVGDGRLLSWDFANTIFDWQNMLEDYATQKDYTEEQANAVAQLMAAVGVSVDMQYTESGSGAMSREARYGLINYFSYNENINWVNRSFYTVNEWMKLIYSELNNLRPVYYTGDDERNGGHAFVLDGYDKDGFVHINWGWGPNAGNGYYDIALLNPSSYQFSEGQDMLIGISPEKCLQYESRFYSDAELGVKKTASLLNVRVGKIYNQTGDDFTGDIAVIMESNNRVKFPIQLVSITKAITYYYVNSGSNAVTVGGMIKIPSTIPDGEYRVYVASKCDKDSDWRLIRVPEGKAKSFIVTVKGGKLVSVGDGIIDDSWVSTKIHTIITNGVQLSSKSYNLNGQQVVKSYHGIIIKNGKKMIQ